MADRARHHHESEVIFTVASTAIPAGVRCGACGRLYLPQRIASLTQPDAAEPTLRCTRCGAVGPLATDPSNPTHLEILRAIHAQQRFERRPTRARRPALNESPRPL